MSNANDALFSENPSLLTLKGEVSVHFLDGDVIDGEFATQDAFNIFLTVEGEPMMIPRHQVRYIKGKQGQPIEEDTSQKAFFKASSMPALSLDEDRNTTEEYVVEGLAAAAAAADDDDDDDDDGTFVLPAGVAETFADDDDDDDDGTVVLGPADDIFADDDGDDDDGTVVLPAGISELVDEDEDEDDGTVILAGLEPGLDSDTTVTPESEKQVGVFATLVCIGGPHTGQTFNLEGDTITIGRSSDNTIVLSGDKEISRHHSNISKRGDKFVVQDNDSLNGTFVNDERVTTPRTLENNDVVVVGISALKYQEE